MFSEGGSEDGVCWAGPAPLLCPARNYSVLRSSQGTIHLCSVKYPLFFQLSHVSQMAKFIHLSQPKNAITSFVGYIFPHLFQNVVSVQSHTFKFTTKGTFSKNKSVLVAQILDPICFDNWRMLEPYIFAQVKGFAHKLAQLLPPWTLIYCLSSLSQNISIFRISISW